MPHLFLDRPRLLDVVTKPGQEPSHFFWESLNALVYLAGGAAFLVGSFFFFPNLERYQDTGCLLFFVGSLLYLVVTGHDMAEVLRHRRVQHGRVRQRLGEIVAAATYLSGTILFTAGSVFFSSLIGWVGPGAWTFIAGSGLFMVGATINLFQIVRAGDMLRLLMMNLTAVAFLVGSVLFTVASIPYLWEFDTPEDGKILYGFLAWQFLAGSVLFLTGGLCSYGRACLDLPNRSEGKATGEDG